MLALAALTLVAPVLLAGPKHDLCLQQKGSITWPFYYATNPLYDKLCPLIAAVEENEQKLVQAQQDLELCKAELMKK